MEYGRNSITPVNRDNLSNDMATLPYTNMGGEAF